MAGAKYTLKLDAVLGDSKPLNVQLKKTISDLEKSGNTDIKVRIVTDEAGLKQFAVSSKDAFGGAERVVGKYDKKLDGAVKTQKTYSEALDKSTKKQNYFAQGMIQSIKSAAKYALSIGLIYKALQEIGQGVQYIKDLDKEMRDIQIVAGYTDETISDLAVSYNELAKAMGATTLEVASGSLEWIRQGKTIEETQELLRATLMLSKLGNVETAEATEYLTSILNGFKMEAKDTEDVVSKLVAVDNAAATSVKELATALQKSSVSAQAAGVTFEELVAYIGTVSSVTRLSAETVGTSFKTMFARFQDIKDGAIDGAGAINNVEKALGRVTLASGEQMSILDRQTGEFKDFSVVLEQLAGQWDNLSEMEQANIVKSFAGVRQRESFLALMENQAMMHELLAEEMNAEGLAADRYAIYLEGLEAAQNKATAAWEGMWQATIDSGIVKMFYDASASVGEFITKLGGLYEALTWLNPIAKGFEKLGLSVRKSMNATEDFYASLPSLDGYTGDLEEYNEEVRKMALDAGYAENAEGDLTKVVVRAGQVVTEYFDKTKLLNEEQMRFIRMNPAIVGGYQKITEEISEAEIQVLAFTESFNQFLEASYAGKEGTTEVFDNLFGQLANINRQFQEGTIDVETYFEQLEDSLENVDMTSMFGGDEESAELFFSGVVSNAAEALDMINTSLAEGEISITNYTEQLSELGDVFQQIGSLAEHFDLGDAVNESLGEIIGGVEELRQAQEANIIVQETMRQITEDGLRHDSEIYAKQVELASQAMAQSGIIYKNHQGDVLQGSKQLQNYMMESAGNFQHLADQTANATGMSINKVVQGAGKMLMELGKAISSFDATISFMPNIKGDVALPGLAGMVGMSLPIVDYKVSATSTGLADIGAAVTSFGEGLATSDFGINMDASIYTQGFDTAAQEFEDVGNTLGSLTNAFNNLENSSKEAAEQIEEDAKSIDALLAMVVKKIKQEQKARKDSLKDQLSTYKQLINARKDLLKTMQEEEDYQRRLEDNQRDLGNVQSEMAELRLDDSEEAQARLRALEEEAAELQNQIDEDAFDRGIELQENALDEEYNNFEDYINAQIDAIDDYLAQPGQIVSDALSMIESQGESLYSELINWNSLYGSGITNDVVTAWDDAYEAMSHYANGLSEITGNNINGMMPMVGSQSSGMNDYGSIPMLSDPSRASTKGESTMGEGVSIGSFMELNVAGNLDSSILPQLEAIIAKGIEKFNNESMRNRGYGQRGAQQFSI